MQRRRGIVSQSSDQVDTLHASARQRDFLDSDSDSGFSSSESSISGDSVERGMKSAELPAEETGRGAAGGETDKSALPAKINEGSEPPITEAEGLCARKKPNSKRKGKSEKSDEERWKKMKLKGSDNEILVDVKRLQKYVDFDSAGITSFQEEVKQAKGNFRQQAMTDYSDL